MAPKPREALPSLPCSDLRWHTLSRRLQLSPQQSKLVELLLRGLDDKAIARHMNVKKSTMRTYLGRVCNRLRASGEKDIILKVFAEAERCPHK